MLDQLLKQLGDQMGGQLGNALGDKQGDFVAMIMAKINEMGGIEALLKQFQGAGLQEKTQSWVSTGDNAPLAPEETKAALGEDFFKDAMAKFGISQEQAESATSEALPQIVDKLTPSGEVPTGDFLEQLKGLTGGQLPDIGGMLGSLIGSQPTQTE